MFNLLYYLFYMKTTLKNSLYTIAWISMLTLNSANAAIDIGQGKIDQRLVGSWNDAVTVIQSWIAVITTLLYIIAVIVILWAGFQVLTAAWDEEKTKKWKTIIIQAMVWLLVIFIASSIITWIINALFTAA
jgi:hypothetical protein